MTDAGANLLRKMALLTLTSVGASSTGRVVAAGAALWVVAALWYFLAEALAAAAMPGYDYVIHYVSELGAPLISPRAALMNAAFFVQGLFFPVAAMLVIGRSGARKSLPFLVFATISGVGNVLVSLVHAGTGSNWHLAGAVLAIAGGNAAILAGTLVLGREIAPTAYVLASGALGATGDLERNDVGSACAADRTLGAQRYLSDPRLADAHGVRGSSSSRHRAIASARRLQLDTSTSAADEPARG